MFDLTTRKLRQFEPGFGLGTCQLTDRDERTIELGPKFVTKIGIGGLANVEFKEDARDGGLTLIECNSRFTLVHQLVRHAGIDLGVLAYNRVVGLPDPPLDRYRTGVRIWHPIEDVRGFVAVSPPRRTDFRELAAQPSSPPAPSALLVERSISDRFQPVPFSAWMARPKSFIGPERGRLSLAATTYLLRS